MKVEGLESEGVPGHAVQKFLDKGIEDLNPPQVEAVENGLLEGESMVISSPTASGKTLIASMAISRLLEETDRKALYLVPLKALGSEKYRDYQEFFEGSADSEESDRSSGASGSTSTDSEVALSIGDRDSSAGYLETKDLIIMTVEKLDAVLRHNPAWISQVDLVVVDEIHLLNSEGRGPTLEVTLTRLREMMDFQLLGLSATINNSEEMADWLDSTLVESDYRPVTLKEGIYLDGEITFYDGDESSNGTNNDGFVTGKDKLEEERSEEESEEGAENVSIAQGYGRGTLNVLDDTLSRGHQAITFVRSRKSAESEAEKAGKVVEDELSRDEEKELEELASRVRNVLGSPTEQCRRLADCVEKGTAFHHAGLLAEQRKLLEENFRDGLIKGISATPTLAMGVSLPAYRIIVRDVKRYTDNGLQFIPTLEYKQMVGRAGRPEHHDEGHAISIASEKGNKEDIRDRYVLGETENIYSKLAVEPVLRMHALGLVATRFASSFDELTGFFEQTFYAHQYGDSSEVEEKLEKVVENLEEYGFLDEDEGKLEPTGVGKRVAELYIDPYTAHHLLEDLEQADIEGAEDIAFLHSLSQTVEMKPRLRIGKNEKAEVEDMLAEVEEELFEEPPDPWDMGYNQFLKSLKTAMMLKEWIEEEEEDELMDRYGVTPGGIRSKVEQADWLLYASAELCTLEEWDDAREEVKRLRTRMKHGIKEELLSLVRFRDIGRVRARRLHDDGITSASDIRNASFNHLKNLLGKRTAEKLKEQVGQENVFDKENILDYMGDK
ncbi:MAG: DEAD/DEAH box helicase [Candidatus Nanohaloarchaeota archaeon QJJ-7]|nr:DEAD/DEAH box helicase [Candidatus Nanohaloarchaeota archaeon QJJ-7]